MLEGGVSDLAKWKAGGPVHTLRSEHAEWDLGEEAWRAPRGFTVARFLRDGRLSETEHHNPDGSIYWTAHSYNEDGHLTEVRGGMHGGAPTRTVYSYDILGRLVRIAGLEADGTERETEAWSYDAEGRKTRVCRLRSAVPNVAVMYSIEGTEQGYSADGAATMVTAYNERGLPGEVRFHDTEERLLRRVTFTRNAAGWLEKEELQAGAQGFFSGEKPEGLDAMLAEIFGPAGVFSSTTYTYDEEGRLLERSRRMGQLSEERTTFRYSERREAIEETTEHSSREMGIGDEGAIQTVKESFIRQHVRFRYTYDTWGNWTERVVWSRLEPNPDFQLANTERRQITYYEG